MLVPFFRIDEPCEAAVGAVLHEFPVRGNGCTYHGVSLNVAMDLTPFSWINPCGYAGLATVDMKTLGVSAELQEVQATLVHSLAERLAC